MNDIQKILHTTRVEPIKRLKLLRAHWVANFRDLTRPEKLAITFLTRQLRSELDTTRSN